MKCRPDLCCSSQISMENLMISIAASRVCLSTSPWLSIEDAVQGGLTITTIGQSRRISLLTSLWSFRFLRSNLRPVLDSRTAISMDHPPLSPCCVAAAHILGGEKTSHTSYRLRDSPVEVPGRVRLQVGERCPDFQGPTSATRAQTGVQDSVLVLMGLHVSLELTRSSSCTSAHDLVLGALDPRSQS